MERLRGRADRALAALFALAMYLTPITASTAENTLARADQLISNTLDLGFDIYLFEESLLYHRSDALFIFIADHRQQPFSPIEIEIKIDGQLLFEKRFSPVESAKFSSQGPFPILLTGIAPGSHQFEALIVGAGKRAVTRHTKFQLLKGGATQYIHLGVTKAAGVVTRTQW